MTKKCGAAGLDVRPTTRPSFCVPLRLMSGGAGAQLEAPLPAVAGREFNRRSVGHKPAFPLAV